MLLDLSVEVLLQWLVRDEVVFVFSSITTCLGLTDGPEALLGLYFQILCSRIELVS